MMAGEGAGECGGRLDYRGKMILAPMVKVILSVLPRLTNLVESQLKRRYLRYFAISYTGWYGTVSSACASLWSRHCLQVAEILPHEKTLSMYICSEELIDKRILASERIENSSLKTVDFIDMRDNSLVLRICPEEKSRFPDCQNFHFLSCYSTMLWNNCPHIW